MNLKSLKHPVYNVDYEKKIVIDFALCYGRHYCFVKSSQETYYISYPPLLFLNKEAKALG